MTAAVAATWCRALSLSALVGELRSVVVDPATDEQRQEAAAGPSPISPWPRVRGADPSSWYGLVPLSDDRPVHAAAQPVGSPRQGGIRRALPAALVPRARRWHRAAAAQQSLGTLVHALAADASLPDEALLRRLDVGLRRLDFGAPWHADKQRERARAMVRRLAAWLRANERELVAVELPFQVQVGRAELNGRVDRLERDGEAVASSST